MRNLWLIVKREYVSRGKSSGYIISTLFMAVLLLGSTLAPALMSGRDRAEPLHVLLLDQTGQLGAPLQSLLQAGAQEGSGEVHLELFSGTEEELMQRARTESVAVLIISGSYPADLDARFYSRAIKDLQKGGLILSPLNSLVRSARLEERGVDPAVAMEILQPLKVEERQLTATSDQGRDQSELVGSIFLALGAVMAIYITVLMNGAFVFQGVLEEKISRVMEVMASSVRPMEMMAGKVLGLGALGLTQFLFMALAWVGGNALSKQMVEDVGARSIDLRTGLLALLFLVLGYALSATMMAAAAATISRMEDSQTMMMPLTMIQAIPMLILMAIMENPNGTLATVSSLIPFFTPSIMLARVILGDVPTWQVLLSILLLVASTGLMTWAAGRIYRAAMLSYGGRPSMKQIWSYLKTS